MTSQRPMASPFRLAPRPAWLAALAAALSLAACATTGDDGGPAISRMDRLYLGGSSPTGEVTDADWERFVAEVVTPLFPQGLTLWRAQGQWREADGEITRERVLVIEVLHANAPEDDARLDAIARAYRERFAQETVLRATSPATAQFVR